MRSATAAAAADAGRIISDDAAFSDRKHQLTTTLSHL